MPKQNTTTKQSSGRPFQFENEVVAYVLVHLLAGLSPFDPPGGAVEQVDPQTEWPLDDLLVTVRAHGYRHRLAFSIKSNEQISTNGFPLDFVHDAWEQLFSPAFQESHDYLGLVTVPARPSLKKAVFELLKSARQQDPTSLAAQVELRTNDTIQKLFRSAECPKDLAKKYGVEKGSAGRLLRRMIWVPLDFEDDNSENRARAIEICQRQLRSGSADEAQALWARLKEVADPLRGFGGDIDLGQLVDKLRERFLLRDFPDHTADWERLAENTQGAFSRVPSTIGGAVTLPRFAEHEAVRQAFLESRAVVLLGASGFGKSVIAKEQAKRSLEEGPVLWLDADRLHAQTFAEWRSYLGLVHGLGEIVRMTPAANALLILDGLDRLYDKADFATTAEFIRAARLGDKTSPWRVLITCIPEDWERVWTELVSHGGLPAAPKTVNVGPPTPDELTAIWREFPKLLPLATRHYLAPTLRRPKVLDLLATRTMASEDLTMIGESDLARWFWDREVAHGRHAALRAEAACKFAQYLADMLLPDISLSALATSVGITDVGIDELAKDRVLRRVEGRVSFDHDLYADWVRARQLADVDETGQLSEFLAPRLSSPVWHRALRLYGVQLLEQSHDLEAWTSTFMAVGRISAPEGTLAQDILLESTAFASLSDAHLFRKTLWPLLAEHDGRLLERLLNRLFHTATIPNPTVVEAVVRQAPELELYAAAGARVPYPFYWFGILALLHERREEIPAGVRGLVARAAELWLRSTEQDWPFRKEAAALAVTLGEVTLKEKEEHDRLFDSREADQQVYRAVLASGHEEPEAVTQIVLEASGRRDRRHSLPPLSEEEITTLRAKRSKFATLSLSDSYGPLPAPWPYGPAFRVDGALQKAVLESNALQPLTTALPDVARETVLALLITEPERRSLYNDDPLHDRLALEWQPSWNPPFYTRGPFRSFLATAELEAVSAILQLVDHATDRWVESRTRYLAWEQESSPGEIQTPVVSIQVEDKRQNYTGSSRVFLWSAQGPDSGGVIQTALIALEKHLYDRVDAGDDVTPLVLRLLTESRSLAIVGLLSIFGRRHLNYFRGPLRGLLVSPYIQKWTMEDSIATSWQMDLLSALSPVPKMLQEEYQTWRKMPHRKTNLHDLALFFFLNDPSLRPFFNEAHMDLQAGLQPGGLYEGWPLVENLAAQLDPSNYSELKGEDGKSYIQYLPPEQLRQQQTESETDSETRMLFMMLPYQCRQLLDGNEPVQSETLDRLWASAQRISELDLSSSDDVIRLADGLAGVATVFVLYGGEWLSGHPEQEEWARSTLLDVAHENRVADSSSGIIAGVDRLVFAAEAFGALWADQPSDKQIREIVARIAFHTLPNLVGILTHGAAAVRERLGDDHLRLLRAVLFRAGLEPRLQRAIRRSEWGLEDHEDEPAEDRDALRSELAAIERAFVEGSLQAVVPSLDEIALLEPLSRQGSSRRPQRWRARRRLIEESLLVAAYQGVPNPKDDENIWFPIWERIVLDIFNLLASADRELTEDLDDIPGSWADYFMKRIAGVVAVIENPIATRRLWQPIIDLGASASKWVSRFARHWLAYVLDPNAQGWVVDSWMAMIDTALANPRWKEEGHTINYHHTGELWQALLGLSNFDADVWTDELRPRVRLLRSRLAKWAESHLANPNNVRAFAHFLKLPAASELAFEGFIWLERESQSSGSRFWGRKGQSDQVDDAVFSLLVHVWSVAREALRRDESAFKAFRNLLQILVSRQYPPALELADRVGSYRT